MRRAVTLLLCLALAAVIAASIRDQAKQSAPLPEAAASSVNPGATPLLPAPAADPTLTRRTAIVNAAERADPAIVAVGTVASQYHGVPVGGTLYVDPHPVLAPFPFLGSGVIIDGDRGLVITNSHVVEGLDNVLVTLPDGRQLQARILGQDRTNDLALLQVDEKNLPSIPLGRSDDLMIGEWVLAIGNPFGNLIEDPQPTVTVGVVSALHRDFHDESQRRVYVDMIQTDAGINPGNSGGALVNVRGELVGINTFIISPSGSSAGLGFAIPVNRVRQVVDEILRYGQVRPIYQDFRVRTNTEGIAEYLQQPFTAGAIVTDIDLNGPAAKAGLQVGDVITAINGQPVTSSRSLGDYLFTLRVGEPIQLSVNRSGHALTLSFEPVEDRR
jgi:serine protease Do